MNKSELSHYWLQASFVDITSVAAYLYGFPSRLHTQRLRDKIYGKQPFQNWEVERLETIRAKLLQTLANS